MQRNKKMENKKTYSSDELNETDNLIKNIKQTLQQYFKESFKKAKRTYI